MSKLCALPGCTRRRAGYLPFCCSEHAAAAATSPKEQRTRDWPTEDIVTLRKMWRAGATDMAIATALGRGATSVCAMRGKLGLAGNGGRQRKIA